MTVAELIRQLGDYDPDLPVKFLYFGGDDHHLLDIEWMVLGSTDRYGFSIDRCLRLGGC